MRAVTISFLQTEQDIVDSMLHVMRHGSLRLLTLVSPAAMALFFFLVVWISFGAWPGFTLVVALVGLGLVQLALNWYVVPRAVASRYLVFWELNSQSIGSTTVRLAPDGVTWSGPSTAWTFPWGIVRSVEIAPGGINIAAGSPSTAHWIPARAFPGPDDLEMAGRLAQGYAAEATHVPAGEMEWPQGKQQRKSGLIFAIAYVGPVVLAMLLYQVFR